MAEAEGKLIQHLGIVAGVCEELGLAKVIDAHILPSSHLSYVVLDLLLGDNYVMLFHLLVNESFENKPFGHLPRDLFFHTGEVVIGHPSSSCPFFNPLKARLNQFVNPAAGNLDTVDGHNNIVR